MSRDFLYLFFHDSNLLRRMISRLTKFDVSSISQRYSIVKLTLVSKKVKKYLFHHSRRMSKNEQHRIVECIVVEPYFLAGAGLFC